MYFSPCLNGKSITCTCMSVICSCVKVKVSPLHEHFLTCVSQVTCVTQVIDPELRLKAVCCLRVWTHHDACVVYEDVELLLLWKHKHDQQLENILNVFYYRLLSLFSLKFWDAFQRAFLLMVVYQSYKNCCFGWFTKIATKVLLYNCIQIQPQSCGVMAHNYSPLSQNHGPIAQRCDPNRLRE